MIHLPYDLPAKVITATLYHSELGDGWAPTVLSTEVEHDFIRQSQKGLSDAQDYFIGGSAYPEHFGTFRYTVFERSSSFPDFDSPQYSTTQSGNVS